MIRDFDWSHLQTFLSVAEHGTLSGAARATGGSQPTMGRHIAALEDQLGVRLFDRAPHGLALTPTGADLVEHARAMATAANQLSLTASGRSERIGGTIRITASEIMSTYTLPAILTALHRAEPEIEVELVSSDRSENLLQREADIAIRMYRPTQADVFTKKVGDLQLAMFAAHDYIARRGAPTTLEEFRSHDVIGYDRSEVMLRGFAEVGLQVDRHFFGFRCDSQVVGWQMVIAGFGIGFNQLEIGLAEPAVQRIVTDTPMPALPIWLTAHSELKTSRRVRRVFDFLAEALKTH
ncbi:LysR family transcriptional regulator [Maricaulis salignorans]|uniref:LysR family transcriptional regulator n=1 Tax=Maricaulis salignorans TaxID=144026 RepID=UPI003A956E2B